MFRDLRVAILHYKAGDTTKRDLGELQINLRTVLKCQLKNFPTISYEILSLSIAGQMCSFTLISWQS